MLSSFQRSSFAIISRRTSIAFPQRSLSSYSLQSFRNQSTKINARPSYQVYSDDLSFSLKTIAPEFRMVGSGGTTLVLNKKGRLMLEWVPKDNSTNRFLWDRPLRFALSPEEIGLVVARLKQGQSVEVNRRTQGFEYDQDGGSILKVFRAVPLDGGSVKMICDYEADGQGGQAPPDSNESQGPLGIDLMVGESQVVQSIMECSIPQLTGWSTMMDHSIDSAIASTASPNPHNYGGGGGVPF